MSPGGGSRRAPGRPPPSRVDTVCALVTAGLLALSFPPFHLVVLPFIALVPLLVSVDGMPVGPAGRRAAGRAGLLSGAALYALLLYWIAPALAPLTVVAVPAYLALVLVLAGFTAAFAAALHAIRRALPAVPLALAAATLWTAVEWVQAHLGPFAFSWLGLGTALSAFPRLAGAADVVGARGLTFLLMLVNGFVAAGLLAAREPRGLAAARAGLGAVAVVACLAGYGVWRAETLRPVPVARIAVVQPDVSAAVKADSMRAVPVSLAALARLTGRVRPGTVDLVVWPETALPATLDAAGERAVRDSVRSVAARVGAPILLGGYGTQPGKSGRAGAVGKTNAAFLVNPAGMDPRPYAKHRLVPFVERVPFAAAGTGLSPGSGDPGFRAAGQRFGVLICFESAFPGRARSERLDGARFLVNITNDAWYEGPPWAVRSTALWQHPAQLVLRAIETRTGIARAANTGFSLFIDPLGRVHHRTALFRPAVAVATVWTTEGETPFVRWGDVVGRGATALAALLLLAAGIVGARARSGPGGERAAHRRLRRPQEASIFGARSTGRRSAVEPAPRRTLSRRVHGT